MIVVHAILFCIASLQFLLLIISARFMGHACFVYSVLILFFMHMTLFCFYLMYNLCLIPTIIYCMAVDNVLTIAPSLVLLLQLQRNILASNPRMTKFSINWD